MKHMRSKRFARSNEGGLVSIIVCMSLMIILGLITIGFGRLMQRELRQALDRQLSTQAFYAAETAINDTIKLLPEIIKNKVECGPDNTVFAGGSGASWPDPTIDAAAEIEYTCLTVNLKPKLLVFDTVTTDKPIVTPIRPEGNSMSYLHISWSAAGNPNTYASPAPTFPSFPPAGQWVTAAGAPATPILRIDLVPLASTFTRDSMLNGMQTFFLYPTAQAGDTRIGYNAANPVAQNGSPQRVACNNNIVQSGTEPHFCNFRLTGMPAGFTGSYMLQMRPIYGSASVTVEAGIGAGAVSLLDSQAIVDSTGKANDVLRRVQVRVTRNPNVDLVSYVVEAADDICKRLVIAQTALTDQCTGVTIPLAAVSPPPPPIPPDDGGNAGISEECKIYPERCKKTRTGPPMPHWSETMINTSVNPAGSVTGCTWDFGDGVRVSNRACNTGDGIMHTWPKIPQPFDCNRDQNRRINYTVKLTVFLGGGKTATKNYAERMPKCYGDIIVP